MPTKALGIPYVGNKWAHMGMFSAALPAGDPRRYQYLDLTFGCGICSVFMYELGCRTFILNDASPYPRLIARALLGRHATKIDRIELRDRISYPGYRKGWAAENVPTKAIRHRTACTIDAVCHRNRDRPLILVAVGAVLSAGAMNDFRYGTTKHWEPNDFLNLVWQKAERLNQRVCIGATTIITGKDYLNIDEQIISLKDFVCYLDPAWPHRPEIGSEYVPNRRVYGFYAQKIMSILRQEDMPMPAEYSVTLDECYEGMRRTIELLRPHNSVLIAYQSTPDKVESVKAELLGGLEFEEFKERRKSGTKMWEYLWRIK